jgi:hypothetical protein
MISRLWNSVVLLLHAAVNEEATISLSKIRVGKLELPSNKCNKFLTASYVVCVFGEVQLKILKSHFLPQKHLF